MARVLLLVVVGCCSNCCRQPLELSTCLLRIASRLCGGQVTTHSTDLSWLQASVFWPRKQLGSKWVNNSLPTPKINSQNGSRGQMMRSDMNPETSRGRGLYINPLADRNLNVCAHCGCCCHIVASKRSHTNTAYCTPWRASFIALTEK